MKPITLTKASKKELEQRHPGSGHAFVSTRPYGFQHYAIQTLITKNGKYLLRLGNLQTYLTDEQIAAIGSIFVEDNDL